MQRLLNKLLAKHRQAALCRNPTLRVAAATVLASVPGGKAYDLFLSMITLVPTDALILTGLAILRVAGKQEIIPSLLALGKTQIDLTTFGGSEAIVFPPN
jgi:hypothetical protein